LSFTTTSVGYLVLRDPWGIRAAARATTSVELQRGQFKVSLRLTLVKDDSGVSQASTST